MKHQFELTDEINNQTPPEFRWLDFSQEVARVCTKLDISKAEIARRMEISPTQLNKLMTGKDGANRRVRDVSKYYFLALRAIEFEKMIYAARAKEET